LKLLSHIKYVKYINMDSGSCMECYISFMGERWYVIVGSVPILCVCGFAIRMMQCLYDSSFVFLYVDGMEVVYVWKILTFTLIQTLKNILCFENGSI
jgi:hypothetical protein